MNAKLDEKLNHGIAELDSVTTAVAVAECERLDEISVERRRCADEVATLHQLMKGLSFCLIVNVKFSVAFVYVMLVL